MRARQLCLVVAATAALVAGCGNRNLILDVDVLSYIEPAQSQYAFGPIPALPGGLNTGEQPLVNDLVVHLVENVSEVASVQSVALQVEADAASSSGSGSGTLRMYLSDGANDPRGTEPVVTLPVTFTDGQTDHAVADISGDARIVDLFRQREMRLSITGDFHGPESGPSLNGQIQITKIRAIVVAGHKGT